jgi:hypothetical protein
MKKVSYEIVPRRWRVSGKMVKWENMRDGKWERREDKRYLN